MTNDCPERLFAIEVAKRLQDAGFNALWAGGCVRDQLLGQSPKDYDVATSATPDQIRELFGHRRTIAIGAAFGVITVLGPRHNDAPLQIEVATFRCDAEYSDGRRPDHVTFTDAQHDAERRDFTMNGMFYDPLRDEVIDYVGGQQDLESKIVRAIGDPHQRIKEDKLRMLRAIRFATTLEFAIDPATKAAVSNHSSEIRVVSAERIGAEIQKILTHHNRDSAVELLIETDLLELTIAPEENLFPSEKSRQTIMLSLRELGDTDFETAAAALLYENIHANGIDAIVDHWRISNHQRDSVDWIVRSLETIIVAGESNWPRVQPLLLNQNIGRVLKLAAARNRALEDRPYEKAIAFCNERLEWPPEQLDPAPLIDGKVLKELGIEAGPIFHEILQSVRDRQLAGEITNAEEAKEAAIQFIKR